MDIPSHAQLVEQIDEFLTRHRMAPSRFGREISGEPNLVTSIREGREPNLGTLRKIAAFMGEKDAKAANEGDDTSFIASEGTSEAHQTHRLSAVGR